MSDLNMVSLHTEVLLKQLSRCTLSYPNPIIVYASVFISRRGKWLMLKSKREGGGDR